MAENSKIQWTTHTMNFWTGCQEVSAACDNCYARWQWASRAGRDFHERIPTAKSNWKKPYKWNAEAGANGERAFVFTNSLADFLDNQAAQLWRDDACQVIEDCVSLDWQILTKRPQNAPKMLPRWMKRWPDHAWIGASAGDRVELTRNLRHLHALPAKVKFLSLEPLLEDVGEIDLAGISWVIVSGESGAKDKIRPLYLAWVRSVIDQCRQMVVPVFVKQLGGKPYGYDDRITFRGCDLPIQQGFNRYLNDRKGGDPLEWPEDLRVREMPK